MYPHELDHVFELWARWIRGTDLGGSGLGSMLEMMMVTGCMFSGGGGNPALHTVQAEVEAAVMQLAVEDRSAANVLRYEYGAWVLEVNGLDKKVRQIDKAHALFISLPTYKRRLAKAREFVADQLSQKRVAVRGRRNG